MAQNNSPSPSSTTGTNPQRPRTSNRGFASMDPARQREIASQGGRAAHRKGTAHEFTSEEARIAGSKGGQARGKSRKAQAAAAAAAALSVTSSGAVASSPAPAEAPKSTGSPSTESKK